MRTNNETTHTAPRTQLGVLSVHPRGFGFLRCADGTDYFVPAAQLRGRAIPGDCFEFRAGPADERGQARAVLLALQHRPATQWLGELRDERGSMRFVPDETLPVTLALDETAGAKPGDVLLVRVADGATGKASIPATVVRNLGPRGGLAFEVDYAIARYGLRTEFPQAAREEAAALGRVVRPEEMEGRVRLESLPFVTIDGETTRDFDDAVYAEPVGSGFRLCVAVADVSHYVRAGSALDNEAFARGTSVYFPEQVLPMLPEELSNEMCSLNPDAPRLAVVCDMRFDSAGRLLSYRFDRAVIRSRARLTYAQVDAFLLGAAAALPAAVKDSVRTLGELTQLLNAARADGALDGMYEAREPKLVATGREWRVQWTTSDTAAHRLIEECMLAANRCAAAHLALRGGYGMFRYHAGVDPEAWDETRAWLQARGLVAPAAPSTADMRALLDLTAVWPDAALVHWRIRRCMTAATYDALRPSHFTLGFAVYAHFTSPIRRYADLTVHRLLLGEPTRAEDIALPCAERARRAQLASRFVWDRIKRRALVAQHAQEVLHAQVASCSRHGLRAVVEGWATTVSLEAEHLASIGLTFDGDGAWKDQVAGRLEPGAPCRVRIEALDDVGARCEVRASLVQREP